MDNKDIEKIKLVVDLTLAKVEILRLKADDYNWQCNINEEGRKQLLSALDDIDALLTTLDDSEEVEEIVEGTKKCKSCESWFALDDMCDSGECYICNDIPF